MSSRKELKEQDFGSPTSEDVVHDSPLADALTRDSLKQADEDLAAGIARPSAEVFKDLGL